jgi:hypothetical protein
VFYLAKASQRAPYVSFRDISSEDPREHPSHTRRMYSCDFGLLAYAYALERVLESASAFQHSDNTRQFTSISQESHSVAILLDSPLFALPEPQSPTVAMPIGWKRLTMALLLWTIGVDGKGFLASNYPPCYVIVTSVRGACVTIAPDRSRWETVYSTSGGL